MTEDHLESIKARLVEIEARLARIEALSSGQAPSVQPPPIFVPRAQPPAPVPPTPTKLAEVAAAQQGRSESAKAPARGGWDLGYGLPKAPKVSADTEYRLGGQVLPWIGAVITILSIGFGVSLAFQHGFVTPQMIFAGGIALCVLFIAVGQWKRDEREEFGQILTGIGSCGLYITFAAGHLVQHLYEGEALVQMFTALSLANLAYSFWRSSRAFLIVGLLGGFAAALMPLDEAQVALSLGLHFLILVPSAAIVFHRRWLVEARFLWVVGLLVLLPGFTHAFDWRWQVAATYGTALLCMAAYARSWSPNEWDANELFGPAMLAASAGIAFSLHQGPEGSVHVILFGLVLAGFSTLRWDPVVKTRSALGALAIPLILAPCGALPFSAGLIFAALGLALAAGSRLLLPKALSVLAGVEFILAASAYLMAVDRGLAWGAETVLLGALVVSGVAAAASLIRSWEAVEPLFLGATLAVLPLVVRLSIVVLGRPLIGADLLTAETWGLVAGASVLAGFGIRKGWTSAVGLSIAVVLLALVAYAGRLDQSVQNVSLEMLLLVSMSSVVILTGFGVLGKSPDSRASLIAWVGLLLGLIVSRALFVLLVFTAVRADPNFAASIALAFSSVVATVVSRTRSLPSLVVSAWILWAGAGAAYVAGLAYDLAALEIWILAALGAAGLSHALAFDSVVTPRTVARAVELALGWLIFSRLVSLLLAQPPFEIGLLGGVTIAWTVYAAILLGAGFARRVVEMRWFGLAVLGLAAVKLIWFDLAGTSDLLRFGVTLALGIAMIGGGYLYIRLRDRLGTQPPESEA